MACSLRGIWVFADDDVKLLVARRFPTVERRIAHHKGYEKLPNDETVSAMFVREVLYEEEDRNYYDREVPSIFKAHFQPPAFVARKQQGTPIFKLGKVWPAIFVKKKGFFFVAAVALPGVDQCPSNKDLVDLPQITSAFVVLEEVADFIPSDFSSDLETVSMVQYYLKMALPFGSPVNTNYPLLKKARTEEFGELTMPLREKMPAWKPYFCKGKPKLMVSVVETVNCTLYGGSRAFKDECFITGSVYCSAEIPGLPEISIPLTYYATGKESAPCISVYNCATLRDGEEEQQGASAGSTDMESSEYASGSFSASSRRCRRVITCKPPSSPFVLCRYRYPSSPVGVLCSGIYRVKEVSPSELRVFLEVSFPFKMEDKNASFLCQVRLPFKHRGVIKKNDLRSSGASCPFNITDNNQTVLWNVRSVGEKTSLVGDLTFESNSAPAHTTHGTEGGMINNVISEINKENDGHVLNSKETDYTNKFFNKSRDYDGYDWKNLEEDFVRGMNCYCEIFMKLPGQTLSGVNVDPKAISIYPRLDKNSGSGMITVQSEVLTGKYIIWNSAGEEVRGHHLLTD